MPDEPEVPAENTALPAESTALPAGSAGHVAAPQGTTEVAVVRAPEPPAVVWRRRALAVREALPELARNPVVLGASAAAATIAARVALDVVRHLAGAPAPTRPAATSATSVTGRFVHVVHHVHHVHVVHSTGGAVVLRALPEDRGR